MSWQIPTLIEADIKSGKAQYRTFQTGNGGQSILPVPPNSYVVIFGYDFSPAGGGMNIILPAPISGYEQPFETIRWLETQQIAFYTGTDFYPFIHHVEASSQFAPRTIDASAPDNNTVTAYTAFYQINSQPIARQTYITSTNDVTITVGLILNSPRISGNAIPVTNRTPQGLTYGGSGQVINTQTNYGAAGNPQQFMQPSPKDYEDFAFGLLPANADNQAFATPDAVNGLYDADALMRSAFPSWSNSAAGSYYLNLHYALYTETVPDSRG